MPPEKPPPGIPIDLEESVRLVTGMVKGQRARLLDGQVSARRVGPGAGRDLSTQVDIDVERDLKRQLRAAYPEHGLWGEETGGDGRDTRYKWLIDPIDGTKYYAAQSSLYSVSVALLCEDEPVLGVVYSPPSDACFTACRGSGAFLNGSRLHGSQVEDLSQVIANVDLPNTDALTAEERQWFESRLVALTRGVYRVRSLGSGALASCWLATGALDAYVDLTGYVKVEDTAAGRVIMQEAGIRQDYLDPGHGPPRLLAAPQPTFGHLRRLLLS
jgi:myo-inositol-1(or 4)-monophosphatase